MENTALLQNIYLFHDLSRFELIQVNKIVHTTKVAAGETIIEEGDPANEMYIIKNGLVSVYVEGTDSSKEVLATLGPGDHFGEMSLIDNSPRSASVEASEDTELMVLSTDKFRSLIDSEVAIKVAVYEAFLSTLCARLRATNDAAIIYRIQAQIEQEL